VVLAGCSQEKNTIVNRSYHNLTARYNGFFNGRLALQDAHNSMKESYQDDYTTLLPIFIAEKDEVAQPTYPQLERAITKTSMVVDRHSMDISGKENCKWIDDTWIIMGEAQYLKKEYTQAKQIFDFTKRKYPDPKIEQLSHYWLARIYTSQEQYTRAGDELRKLDKGEGFPEKLMGDLFAFKANFYLQQSKNEEAIEQLQKSIAVTRNRDEKTRRMFILAQLLRIQGDGISSSNIYAEVIKRNPEYEMSFYSKINRALAYDVTAGNVEEIRKILFKMLKDDKNIEYQDQIYYALAELELKEDDEPEGIEYLKLATKKSVKNGNTKGLAFYRLGEIYFAKENYIVAQAYYDSTVAFLSPEHPEYDQILATANNLTQMMRDITIIDREDSLQVFAGKPKKEQERIIDIMIEDLIQAEIDAKRQKQLEESQAQANKFNQNTQINRNITKTKGEWYFYNPAAVGFGASEFKKIWRDRKNEDDWRRKDKTSVAPLLLAGDDDLELESDTTEGANDPKNPNFYWKSVPDTEEKLVRSNALIIEALYDLAMVYKDQMQDEDLAIETFEDLVSRYDSSKYHPNSYYQLYLMFLKRGNEPKTAYYKALIIDEYPETDYAKVIENPEYAAESVASETLLEEVYAKSYTYFRQGFYTKSYGMAIKAIEEYPESDYLPKFKLLEALCLGHIDGEARMISELEEVARVYGSLEEGEEARKILAYFKNGKEIETIKETEEKAMEESIEEKKKQYTYDIGAQHNFVIIIPDTADHTKLQAAVSDFNRKYFGTKGFKTSLIPIKDGLAMVVVSKVGFAAQALNYYNTFSNAGSDTDRITNHGYPYFAISFDNYAKFYKDQFVDAYLAFFTENYVASE
jgi:tetratricopeptide (TPR) repeat protein